MAAGHLELVVEIKKLGCFKIVSIPTMYCFTMSKFIIRSFATDFFQFSELVKLEKIAKKFIFG